MPEPTMRAASVQAYGAIEGVTVGPRAMPVPGAGEVLIEIHAAPVNFVDLLVIGGGYQFLPPLPFVPGKGPAGIVIAHGPGVTAPAIGTRVLAMAEQGGYATHAVARADQCYALPESMRFTQAAAMSLAYDTALMALRERGRFQPGESVLILGASGAVGLAAIQLVKALGGRALAAISRPDRAANVLQAGADAVIDLSVPDLRDALRDQVLAGNNNKLADIVLDQLGGDAFDAALRAMAWCGRMVVVGFAAGRIPSVKVNYLMVKNIEVSGFQVSDYRKRRPERMAACFAEIFTLASAGKIRPPATIDLPLHDIVAALRLVRDRATDGHRVILLPRA